VEDILSILMQPCVVKGYAYYKLCMSNAHHNAVNIRKLLAQCMCNHCSNHPVKIQNVMHVTMAVMIQDFLLFSQCNPIFDNVSDLPSPEVDSHRQSQSITNVTIRSRGRNDRID